MTSIIILTYNNLEYTKLCFESIDKFTEKDSYELIVVDNNSTDGTVEWLLEQDGIIRILNKENVGFPKGCNQGIDVARGENILLLNNDTIVTNDWLTNLIKCLDSSEDIGAVGPVTNSCAYYQSIPVNYNSIVDMHSFAVDYNVSNEELWEDRLKLIGFCLLVKRKVLEEIGILDEVFTPGNFEDDDLCCRIYNNGYRVVLCKDTFIHHYGGTSFKKLGGLNSLIIENELRFKEKWSFSSRENMDIHRELVELIQRESSETFRILEVGCGCGANLLYLKNIYKNAEFYGVDNNKYAIELASRQFNSVCLDIEEMELPFKEKYFDYIILGDIIQQLKNPGKVLEKVRNYIKSEGKLLISVPNIMNYYVIYNMLKGNSLYNNNTIEYFINDRNIKMLNFVDTFNLLESSGYSNISGTKVLSVVESGDHNFIDSLCTLAATEDKDQYITKKYVLSAEAVDSNKICFIFCVNNNMYYQEALKYIQELNVPEGFTIENICIIEAESMTKGYNEAMKASNAKYKIYMHQDVFIINKDFLYEVINTFGASEKLGMLGVIGSKTITADGVWWEGQDKYGKVYENHDGNMKLMKFNEVIDSYEMAGAIDGLIMITQADIIWREDIFDGWHFYDVSQCHEFINRGYKVGIVKQEEPFCIHDCGRTEIKEDYQRYREIFVKEYLENE